MEVTFDISWSRLLIPYWNNGMQVAYAIRWFVLRVLKNTGVKNITDDMKYCVIEILANSYDAILDKWLTFEWKVTWQVKASEDSTVFLFSDNGTGNNSCNSVIKRSGFSRNFWYYVWGYGIWESKITQKSKKYRRISWKRGSSVYLEI